MKPLRGWFVFAAVVCTLAGPPVFAGRTAETSSFTATVSDFRTSVSGTWRIATANVTFKNKLNRPIILAYVTGSGVVTDDQGNRYVIGANGVRGMGSMAGKVVDTKFSLEPGESADARFEFGWKMLKVTLGTKYDMDLTVQEVDSTTPAIKLGKERVLHFSDVGNAGTSTPAAPASTPSAGTAPAAPATDPCTNLPRCWSGGSFIAQVSSLTPVGSTADRHHYLKLNLRFTNVSNQRVVLGYKSATSGGVDNLGNGYTWGRPGTHDTSFSGIGLVTGSSADASFALNPGESRDAAFTIVRFNSGGKQLGTGWSYDVVIEQLEILPSSQVRAIREHSLHFTNLSASMPAIGAAPTATDLDEAVQNLKNLFKKKK